MARNTWLNHAAISPWPRAVGAAMQGFLDDNQTRGPLAYQDWIEVEARLRQRAAALLGNGRPDDIALVANTSTGLNHVALGLDWQPGDSVLFPANDFPSNRLPWTSLHHLGVRPRAVQLNPRDPEGSLISAIGPSARLLAVSSVQYDTGLRLDLERLGEACERQGVLFCIDAIQHLGALPLDPEQVRADFIVAGSHKWLLAPEGLALFWSRPEARALLAVKTPGWRMFSDPFNFSRRDWTPPADARRFEPGTLNMAGIHGLDAAVGLLLAHGPESIGNALLDRSQMLSEAITAMPGVSLCSPSQRGLMAGIVSIVIDGSSPEAVVARLSLNDIHAAVRGPMVRLSPHFYTPFEQLEQLLRVLRASC